MDRIITAVGQANGEPGPATITVQIADAQSVVLTEVVESIGNSTSDFAAYNAVLRCLQLAIELDIEKTTELTYEVRTSSDLVQQQLSHTQTITEPGLIPFFIEIHNLRIAHFPRLTYTVIDSSEHKKPLHLSLIHI